MNKEELLNSDFFKQFKTGEELTSFLGELQKRGIEALLEGELDAQLDYEKHQKSKSGNYRNGHTTKQVKSSLGETQISVLRDHEGSFYPMIAKTTKYH